MLELMEEYPDFRFSQSSAQFYVWMEQYYPLIFEKIKNAITEDRWEIVGGSWVEHSGLLVSEESLVRQHLMGQRYFHSRFGKTARIGWLPDTFGFQWSMPQIYRNFGIKYFVTSKLKHQLDRNPSGLAFPHNIFWWKGPDESQILACHSVGGYGHRFISNNMLSNQFEALEKSSRINRLMFLYGKGDHGGGPFRKIIKKIEQIIQKADSSTEYTYSLAKEYFEDLDNLTDKIDLPVVDDELFLGTHRGTLTTESFVKVANRRCEELLLDVEKLWVIANTSTTPYPKAEIEALWKMLLFGQVHDNLDGTSIEEVYNDAACDYFDIACRGNQLLDNSLVVISRQVNTTTLEGKPLLIFNTLPWERSEVLALRKSCNDDEVLTDAEGKLLLQQNVLDITGQPRQLCRPSPLPPTGHIVIQRVKRVDVSMPVTDLLVDDTCMENDHLKVRIHNKTGVVTHIFDKKLGIDMLGGDGLRLRCYKDRPDDVSLGQGEPAWNIYLKDPIDLVRSETIRLIERGPLRATIQAVYRLGMSHITMRVALEAGKRMVDFEMLVNWHEHYRTLHMVLELPFRVDFATYEIPFGCIQRYNADLSNQPTSKTSWPERPWEIRDSLKWEVSAQRWIDVSNRSEEFGLLLLNDCRYGFSLNGDELSMTLLRSPSRGYDSPPKKWTDQSSMTYVGQHVVRWKLCPHEGNWQSIAATRLGMAYNYSPRVAGCVGGGDEPLTRQWLTVEPENVVSTTYKMAEDGKHTILRIFETRGEMVKARVILHKTPLQVWRVDMMETGEFLGKEKVQHLNNEVIISLKAFQIITLCVHFT
jgi:alpha-mannosidase